MVRRDYQDNPPRQNYLLTDRAKDLQPIILLKIYISGYHNICPYPLFSDFEIIEPKLDENELVYNPYPRIRVGQEGFH